MKKHYSLSILFISCLFLSCGKDEKKQQQKNIVVSKKSTESLISKAKDTLVTDTIPGIPNDSVIAKSVLKKTVSEKEITERKPNSKGKKKKAKNPDTIADQTPEAENSQTEKVASFIYFRKMLADCKIGQTLTQKELTKNYNIPKDGIKLIKSITKIAEDEIAIKWHKTWFVEKVSDAKFNDASMKVSFKENKMYTSGNAIGIKFNQKTYTDLIIIGSNAYIPSVKGYHWQIGK
ncbi:hypothetical protein GON26_14920 [Flavobacterium sp. GA093]|uniref:Lipoprotein n=1 Tax=Flavobacterium hydrocarbonoxydans TaxID=2683249 RepID=A0A6I4NX84_9FLAO|nr:hypothetical protein [Flavobacterium hydrocarbonoxydans]MWB95657.1 hypothetical protein [Flavobacterium hydrocarbonoxydans]